MKKSKAKTTKSCCDINLDEFSLKTISKLSGKKIAERVAKQSKILDGMTTGECFSKSSYFK